MTWIEFFLFSLIVLGSPGPTNALLSLSGATVGIARSAKLLISEVAGYITIIIPVATILAPLMAGNETLSQAAKLVAAMWVFAIAIMLWLKGSPQRDPKPPTMMVVLVTTLLNPKATIVATVIFPHGNLNEISPWLLAYSCTTVVMGFIWILLGASLGSVLPRVMTPLRLSRIASCCLVLFSAMIARSAFI